MNDKQKLLIKKVKEILSECATEDTRIIFAEKGELHEYDGREFSARDWGNEEEDGYVFVCFNGYMVDGDMQEVGWSDEEISYEELVNNNYSIPTSYKNFDVIAVKHIAWHINEKEVYYTCSDEPGGIETDMYYCVID